MSTRAESPRPNPRLLYWLKTMDTQADRTGRAFVMEEAVAILARTPATLDALLRVLPDDWVRAHEGDKTWSSFDVVAHLINADRTNWIPRARIILNHGETRPFDEFNRFAHFAESHGRTMASLLDEFASVRQNTLSDLRTLRLTDSDLERRGDHPTLGVVTLRQLLATWVAHDLDHVAQISRVLARQYSDEVGPWRAYLRIVREVPGSATS
jgi:DinB superfamily